MPTEEQIKLLIALQRLDSQIFKLRKELEAQPVFLRNLDEAFKEKETTLKEKEEELKGLTVKRKEKEMDLQAKEDSIKKLQAQLYQIKTNKEYQAMEKEISGQKADVSVIEEEIIKVLDIMDECSKEIAREKNILGEEQKKIDEEKKKIAVRTKDIEASLGKLNSERELIAQKVDKEFLVKYERILHSKDGLAMVDVIDEACGGCNINLPPQVINEIKLKQELIFCGSCARILYIEDGEGSGQ